MREDENVIDLTHDAPEAGIESQTPLGHEQLWHELYSEGRVVVFTDGACCQNQRADVRSAGVGVFWGRGNDRN
eukprot:1796336-Karenia_brevis.AAC.1